jgi:uncharacterized membrane protein YtjA (UPF0391 family)
VIRSLCVALGNVWRVSAHIQILGDRLTFSQNGLSVLYYALLFLLVGLIAGFFGFYNLEGTAAMIARVLCVVFVILFLLSLITGRRPKL